MHTQSVYCGHVSPSFLPLSECNIIRCRDRDRDNSAACYQGTRVRVLAWRDQISGLGFALRDRLPYPSIHPVYASILQYALLCPDGGFSNASRLHEWN